MLKQLFGSRVFQKALTVQTNEMNILCSRVSSLNLTPRLFYSTTNTLSEHYRLKKAELESLDKKHHCDLSPSELLRKEALKIEVESSLRPRCLWLKEENEKLLRLVKEHGKRWTFISKFFVDRPASTLMNRYELLVDRDGRGPWKEDEIKLLKELCNGRRPDEIDNWEEIQAKLPYRRPLFLIRQKYIYSLNPSFKLGRWSDEESDKLMALIERYGESNMDKIATLMGSRSKRQCLERWRWQMKSAKKGRFSSAEDEKIIEAVTKYGENFAVVAKVIGSDRTARHISQHYRSILSPDIDRKPWTYEEMKTVYEACLKNEGNMLETKKQLGTKRSIRDLWNHFLSYKKFHGNGEKQKEQQ